MVGQEIQAYKSEQLNQFYRENILQKNASHCEGQKFIRKVSAKSEPQVS